MKICAKSWKGRKATFVSLLGRRCRDKDPSVRLAKSSGDGDEWGIEDQVLPPNAARTMWLSIDLTFQLHNLLRGIGRL